MKTGIHLSVTMMFFKKQPALFHRYQQAEEDYTNYNVKKHLFLYLLITACFT